VYSLDQTQKDSGALKSIGSANLQIGQTTQLPGGVSVTFDGWVPWAGLQVSHDPTQTYLLIAAAAMVIGLIGSLSVRRRRVWLRMANGGRTPGRTSSGTPAAAEEVGSPTVVSVGGLARSDSGNFTDEFAALLARLRSAAPPLEPALASSSGANVDAEME
jgi:cytochrome c biogenesis protein